MSTTNQTEKTIKLIQLVIAVGLACVGGLIQFAGDSETEVVVLKNDVQRGQPVQLEDFTTIKVDPRLVPAQCIGPDDFSAIENLYYRRSEKKDAVALKDLIIDQAANPRLELKTGETSVRIPLPEGVLPEDLALGSMVTLQISTNLGPTVPTNQNTNVSLQDSYHQQPVRLIECGEFRIISVGSKYDRLEDRWESIDGAEFVRIAVPIKSPHRKIIELATLSQGSYQDQKAEIIDIFTKS